MIWSDRNFSTRASPVSRSLRSHSPLYACILVSCGKRGDKLPSTMRCISRSGIGIWCLSSSIRITCTRVKNSATDSLASISSVSNSRFALSYSTSSDAFAIFVRARQASEIDPIRITIFNNSCSFSKALVSDCQAFSEMSTSLGSCTLSNSARGVPEVLTIISESSAESQPLIEAHVRKRCKKVGKFSRPLSSGTVDGTNIPILLGGAAAVSIGAVGAAARPLRSMYSPSLRWNSSTERSSFPRWFKNSLVNSSILSCRSSGLESSTGS